MSRWPRCWGPATARWSSPAGRPRPLPRRCTAPPRPSPGNVPAMWWRQRSSTPPCASQAARHDLTLVGCDRLGRVDPEVLLAAVPPDTALVHLQWGNHEVGVTQPVAAVVAACRERGILVHVDSAQAVGHVPIDFGTIGADLMSVSAHKMGGPPGVGALLVRRGCHPLLVGGDQSGQAAGGLRERARHHSGWRPPPSSPTGWPTRAPPVGRRSGSSPRCRRCPASRSTAIPTAACPTSYPRGWPASSPRPSCWAWTKPASAAHSGGTHAPSEDLAPSPVLEAMGVDAHHSLRISVGWSTTDDDVDALLREASPVLARLRALRG